jgi:hypothetical protein
LMHDFEIDLALEGAIARGPGGKYEGFRSELGSPGATE